MSEPRPLPPRTMRAVRKTAHELLTAHLERFKTSRAAVAADLAGHADDLDVPQLSRALVATNHLREVDAVLEELHHLINVVKGAIGRDLLDREIDLDESQVCRDCDGHPRIPAADIVAHYRDVHDQPTLDGAS
jgi:hypothetical protein